MHGLRVVSVWLVPLAFILVETGAFLASILIDDAVSQVPHCQPEDLRRPDVLWVSHDIARSCSNELLDCKCLEFGSVLVDLKERFRPVRILNLLLIAHVETLRLTLYDVISWLSFDHLEFFMKFHHHLYDGLRVIDWRLFWQIPVHEHRLFGWWLDSNGHHLYSLWHDAILWWVRYIVQFENVLNDAGFLW